MSDEVASEAFSLSRKPSTRLPGRDAGAGATPGGAMARGASAATDVTVSGSLRQPLLEEPSLVRTASRAIGEIAVAWVSLSRAELPADHSPLLEWAPPLRCIPRHAFPATRLGRGARTAQLHRLDSRPPAGQEALQPYRG